MKLGIRVIQRTREPARVVHVSLESLVESLYAMDMRACARGSRLSRVFCFSLQNR